MSKVKDRLGEIKQVLAEESNADTEIDDNDERNGTQNSKQTKTKIKKENKELKKALDKATEIRTIIADIDGNLDKIGELEDVMQREVFKAPTITKDVDAKFKDNSSLAHKAAVKLKSFGGEIKKIQNDTSAESRMKVIQFTSLKEHFKEALNRNGSALERFKRAQINNLKAEIQVANANFTEDDLEKLLEEGNPFQVFTGNLLVDTEDMKRQLADLEERHKQLLQVEERLKEVRDLFQEIAVLIEMQQESINRVEYHAGAATEYIESVDLSKVRKSRRRYLKRKLYLILALSLLLVILIVAIIY